jgi:hypothetical protein
MIGGFLMSCFRAEPFLLFVIFAAGKNDLSQKCIDIKNSFSGQQNSKKKNTHHAKKNQLKFGKRPLFVRFY